MLARGVNEEKIMNFLTLMNIGHKTGCQCCRATIMREKWVQKNSEGAFLFSEDSSFNFKGVFVVEKLKYDSDHPAKRCGNLNFFRPELKIRILFEF